MIIAPGITRKAPSYWLEKTINPASGWAVQVGNKNYLFARLYGPVDVYTFDFTDESIAKVVNQGGGGAAAGTGNMLCEAVAYGTTVYLARGNSGYWADGLFSIFNTVDNTFPYSNTMGVACGWVSLLAVATDGKTVVASIQGAPSSPNSQITDVSPYARFWVYQFSTAGGTTPSSNFTVNFKNGQNNDMEFVNNDTKFYSLCGAPSDNSYLTSAAVYTTSNWTFSKYITFGNKYYIGNGPIKSISSTKAYIGCYYLPNGDWSVYYRGMLAVDTSTDTVGSFIPYTNYTPTDLKRSWITIGGKTYVQGYSNAGAGYGLIQVDTVNDKFVDFLPTGSNMEFTRPALYSATDTLYASFGTNAMISYKKDYPTSSADELLHLEGTAGTVTRVVDYGRNTQVWGINGTPAYTTTNYKFGSSSMDSSTGCLTSRYYVIASTFTTLLSFNLECWIRPSGTSSTTGNVLSLVPNSTSYGPFVLLQNGSTLTLKVSDGAYSAWTTSSAGTLTANTWHHLAVSADGTTFRVFLNGTVIFSMDQPDWGNLSTNVWLGGLGTAYFQGCIDEFRAVWGSAIYTANFTPPTATFS